MIGPACKINVAALSQRITLGSHQIVCGTSDQEITHTLEAVANSISFQANQVNDNRAVRGSQAPSAASEDPKGASASEQSAASSVSQQTNSGQLGSDMASIKPGVIVPQTYT